MDSYLEQKRAINPRQTANIFSKVTFLFTWKLFKSGVKEELKEEDLYEVLPDLDSQKLGNRILQKWNEQKNENKCSVFSLLWNLFGKYYILLGTTKLISVIHTVVRPIVIGKLVSYFIPGQTELTKIEASFYGGLIIVLTFTDSVYRHNYLLATGNLAIKMRTALTSLLYREIFNLHPAKLRNTPIGKITTLITKDVMTFDYFIELFNDVWTGFLSTIIICYSMYQKIGSAMLVLLFTYTLYVPWQVYAVWKVVCLKMETSKKTDKRMRSTQKVLSTIRSTKMYVRDKYLSRTTNHTRKDEMRTLYKMFMHLYITTVSATLVQHFTLYLVIMTYVWSGKSITAEVMYFVVGCFQGVTFTLVTLIPYGMFHTSEFIAAAKRIQKLLRIIGNERNMEEYKSEVKEAHISLRNVTVILADKKILSDVNFDIKKGLTVLTGNTGSGKSVLVMTLLKQYEITEGTLLIEGRLSYASQDSWLFPSTIRQNILFGERYNVQRYQQVLKVCALHHDFNSFEFGDDTVVADRGINLSKGQRTRISLARAIYRESDIYLLDDCLSSLDPLVADFIFKNCIRKFLADKLVVLITYNENFIRQADNVINMNQNGPIVSIKASTEAIEEIENESPIENVLRVNDQREGENTNVDGKLLNERENRVNVYREDKKSGAVSWRVYQQYIKLGGSSFAFVSIFCISILAQFSTSYKDKLVSKWVNLQSEISNYDNGTNDNPEFIEIRERNTRFIYIYSVVIIAIAITALGRAFALFLFLRKVSVNLHKQMFRQVINATMKFFDNNPLGNILNRFSKDLETIDERIPYVVHHIIAILFETLGSLYLTTSINTVFLVPTVLFFIVFIVLKRYYLKVGTALKRMDASTKGPIVAYFDSTLEGLTTIKAFQAENLLIDKFDKHQNLYTSASYSYVCSMRAFVFMGENMTSIFIGFVILQFLIFDEGILPGDVGLALSQAFVMSIPLQFGIYKWAELETQITSVERVFEYTNIKQESKSGLVLSNWVTFGEIKYENVSLSLNNKKSYLLKNISLLIKPGEKVGIVGRTGAGKSSLISVLFRLYEFEGKISIDGIDIKTLSLDTLRSNISVIPQDPVLFDGTFRENIDPEKLCKDDEIWNVVKVLDLKEIIPNLEMKVRDSDFTFGQKQLICLGRILLNPKKVVIFDEISEHVDPKTENLICELIDNYLTSSTVVKIAHRMKFILSCDKIFVLDDGEVVEHGHPQTLLRNVDSLFSKLVKVSDVSLEHK